MMTESQLSLARMLVSVINAREQESARVARFLHDDVGQVLSAIGLQLDVLRIDLRDRTPEIVERTGEMQKLLGEVVERLRDLSYELNPSIVERAGFQFALDRLVGRFRNEFRGTLRLLFDSSVRMPAEVSSLFYKIAEQALDNAVRHSQASQIEVLVRPTLQATAMEIRDNGAGFEVPEPGSPPIGLGLLLMEHYAAQKGLRYSVKSAPGRGTIIKVGYAPSNARPQAKPEPAQAPDGGVTAD